MNTKLDPYMIVTGKPVDVLANFCGCEQEAVTLARWHLWAVQPKNPTVCCSFQFLEWYRFLLLECHVSKRSFLDMISLKNNLLHGQVCVRQKQ